MSEVITQFGNEAFEALVSKGIHALLFPLKKQGSSITVDTSVNLLHGYPVGGFNTSGDTVESEDFQDQIRGGSHKTKIAGAIDPGDITFNAYFAPSMGKPAIEGVVNSMVLTPQFVLALARKKSATTLEAFFIAGVNYAGGNDIKGDYGKAIGSSMKFNISGEPKVGYDACGDISMSLYNGSGTEEVASADVTQTLLDSMSDALMTA